MSDKERILIPMELDLVRNVLAACQSYVEEQRRALSDGSNARFMGENAVNEIQLRMQAMSQLSEVIIRTLFESSVAKTL